MACKKILLDRDLILYNLVFSIKVREKNTTCFKSNHLLYPFFR